MPIFSSKHVVCPVRTRGAENVWQFVSHVLTFHWPALSIFLKSSYMSISYAFLQRIHTKQNPEKTLFPNLPSKTLSLATDATPAECFRASPVPERHSCNMDISRRTGAGQISGEPENKVGSESAHADATVSGMKYSPMRWSIPAFCACGIWSFRRIRYNRPSLMNRAPVWWKR